MSDEQLVTGPATVLYAFAQAVEVIPLRVSVDQALRFLSVTPAATELSSLLRPRPVTP